MFGCDCDCDCECECECEYEFECDFECEFECECESRSPANKSQHPNAARFVLFNAQTAQPVESATWHSIFL